MCVLGILFNRWALNEVLHGMSFRESYQEGEEVCLGAGDVGEPIPDVER